jgi:hypothetical protein
VIATLGTDPDPVATVVVGLGRVADVVVVVVVGAVVVDVEGAIVEGAVVDGAVVVEVVGVGAVVEVVTAAVVEVVVPVASSSPPEHAPTSRTTDAMAAASTNRCEAGIVRTVAPAGRYDAAGEEIPGARPIPPVSGAHPYNAGQAIRTVGVDEQPPRFPKVGDQPAEEPFPTFDPEYTGDRPLPLQRATDGPTRRGSGPANPWLIGLAIAVVLGAVSIIAFGLLAPEDSATGTTAAGGGTTLTTVPGGDPTSTTDGTDTTGTSDATGTTDGGDVTTVPDEPDLGIDPIGDPIPIAELNMTSSGLSPLDFGDPADEVLGRLVATFDQPTEDTGFIVGEGSWGECPGDTIRIVRWGPLAVVTVGEQRVAAFASYRIDLKYGGITHPATDIATLSGLRVGDTVGDLERIYAGFAIEYVVDPDAGLVFELREARDGPLLLWGPVESQNDDALVTGIYSPDSCDA